MLAAAVLILALGVVVVGLQATGPAATGSGRCVVGDQSRASPRSSTDRCRRASRGRRVRDGRARRVDRSSGLLVSTGDDRGNVLYYGDNLDVLRRHVKDETVDLVYLDPPFNSNADYNVPFAEHGEKAAAQIEAFTDTWEWNTDARLSYEEIVGGRGSGGGRDARVRTMLGPSDMLAYLSMMAPRLVELRRVLQSTGACTSLRPDGEPLPQAAARLDLRRAVLPGGDRVGASGRAQHEDQGMAARQRLDPVLHQGTDVHVQRGVHGLRAGADEARYRTDEDGRRYTARRPHLLDGPKVSTQFEWRGVKPPPHRSVGRRPRATREQ
ncbi:MAG: hypothetical protein M5T61_20910, partial [Acidimicrobiia bacterium]|nr:hypothetical protein [Acidimicrobiia bacterium]